MATLAQRLASLAQAIAADYVAISSRLTALEQGQTQSSQGVPTIATADYTVPATKQVLFYAPIDFGEYHLICDGHLIEV